MDWTKPEPNWANQVNTNQGQKISWTEPNELNWTNWTEALGPSAPELIERTFQTNWRLGNWTVLNGCQTILNFERENIVSSRTIPALEVVMLQHIFADDLNLVAIALVCNFSYLKDNAAIISSLAFPPRGPNNFVVYIISTCYVLHFTNLNNLAFNTKTDSVAGKLSSEARHHRPVNGISLKNM